MLTPLGDEDLNSRELVVEDITVVYTRAHWHHWSGGCLFNMRGAGRGEGGYTLTFRNIVVEDSASKRSIRRFVITEKAPTRAFSWLKAATTAFTFKTLLRHYAKRALTPRYLNVKLGLGRNYHKGRAAIRHYANQPAHPL